MVKQTTVNGLTYPEWKKQLINIIVKAGTPASDIKVNDTEAMEWWEDACSPELAFDLNWSGNI